MRKVLFILGWFVLPFCGISQEAIQPRRFWCMTSVNGAIKLGSGYRSLTGITNDIYNYHHTTRFYGGVMANASSCIYHPGFINFDLGVEYNPETGKDNYLVVPDQAEVRTMKKVSATVSIFRQKQINLSGFFNYYDVYTNRENLSNIRSGSQSWGMNFTLGNRFLPFEANYSERRWSETEMATGRTFQMNQLNLTAKVSKSFSRYDKTDLVYFRNSYHRQDFNVAFTDNLADNLQLNNTLYFDKRQRIILTSNLSGIDQRGDDAFSRLQVNEGFTVPFSRALNLRAGYHYYQYLIREQALKQHSADLSLHHKLFESLATGVRGEFSNINHSFYNEQNFRAGADISYNKKLPLDGHLALAYSYLWQRQHHNSDPVAVQIYREDHLLEDGRIELLNKGYVTFSSVIVKDISGTIIYQPGFDYQLIARNNFVEIQRIPGGQIPNGAHVFVDYWSTQPGAYQYDVSYQNFSADLSFFNKLAEVYYRYAKQDYQNIRAGEYMTLNFFNQHICGIRSEYGIFSGGAEYEDYNSSIIPYILYSGILQVQGSIRGRYSYSLTGNYRKYDMKDISPDQTYLDLIGNFTFPFAPQTGLLVEAGYRKQIGQGIDLDLLTARAEFNTVIRQMIIKVGVQIYRRDYLRETTDFFSGSIQIIRNFNWTRK